MKKVLVIFFFSSLCNTLRAQEEAIDKKYFVGGSVSFTIQNKYAPFTRILLNVPGGNFSNNSNDYKSTYLYFGPYIGKELNPKLQIGVNLRYSVEQETLTSSSFTSVPLKYKYKTNQIGLGLFARQIVNPSNTLKFYIQPFVGYYILNEDTYVNSDLNEERVVKHYQVGTDIGLLYNFSKSFRATLMSNGFSYAAGNWKVKDENANHSFSTFYTNFNLSSIRVGFEYRW